MRLPRIRSVIAIGCSLVVWIAAYPAPITASAQASSDDRTRGHIMLKAVRKTLEKHYYDSTYGGLDLDSLLLAATTRIDSAQSYQHIMGIIAFTVSALDDSHTRFFPPSWANEVDYGIELQMIGERAFVTAVDDDSDAALVGVGVGDEVLHFAGHRPMRADFSDMLYLYLYLQPRETITLDLRKPDGSRRTLSVAAQITEGRRDYDYMQRVTVDRWDRVISWENSVYRDRNRFHTIDSTALVWRLPTFVKDTKSIDDAMGKASSFPSLIIDLRGNRGGYVSTLDHLLGYFVFSETEIATEQHRKKTERHIARPHQEPYYGTVVVLVDSRSASASEVAARFLQINQRGTIIGDRSAGAVLASIGFVEGMGATWRQYFAVTVSIYDLIMPDGSRLEKAGVTPDIVILPTGRDLALGQDPVLSHAIGMVGGQVDAQEAGVIFPLTKRDKDIDSH